MAMPGAEDGARALRRFAPALALLSLAVLINYVDRGNLSIAAPLLKRELRISTSQLGILFSAFFWTYTLIMFAAGWLVDRFDVNRVIAAAFLVWSLATAATGLVHGIALLLVMRMMLGIGESATFPACSKILAQNLPERQRGFANGLIIAGLKAGPAVGTFGAGLLMAKYGWRPVFIGIGLASLAWLPAWMYWRPRGEAVERSRVKSSVGLMDIMRQRSFWGATGGHFCGNYILYFFVIWLPFYLVTERHLTMAGMARVAGIYYLVDATSTVITGWVADVWIRRGSTPTLVRKAAMAIGYTTGAFALMGCATANANDYVAWLMVVGVAGGIGGAGTFAFSQTLAGPEAAGRWSGLQNGIANFAGIIGPALTGFIVDRTGHFLPAVAITATISLLGGLSWVFGVGRLETVNWGRSEEYTLATEGVA
jgi:MFS transporter, ACS family, D-galactonate transporter